MTIYEYIHSKIENLENRLDTIIEEEGQQEEIKRIAETLPPLKKNNNIKTIQSYIKNNKTKIQKATNRTRNIYLTEEDNKIIMEKIKQAYAKQNKQDTILAQTLQIIAHLKQQNINMINYTNTPYINGTEADTNTKQKYLCLKYIILPENTIVSIEEKEKIIENPESQYTIQKHILETIENTIIWEIHKNSEWTQEIMMKPRKTY